MHTPLPVGCAIAIQCVSYREGFLYAQARQRGRSARRNFGAFAEQQARLLLEKEAAR